MSISADQKEAFDKEAIQNFQEYLRIESVHPNVNYGEFEYHLIHFIIIVTRGKFHHIDYSFPLKKVVLDLHINLENDDLFGRGILLKKKVYKIVLDIVYFKLFCIYVFRIYNMVNALSLIL